MRGFDQTERYMNMDENEAIIIKRCQSGCRESFKLLYQKYHTKVLMIARQTMENEQDAEDAVQEIFERVLKKIPQFRYEASFSSWLRVLAVNVCRDMIRKRNRHPMESFEEVTSSGKVDAFRTLSISQEEELIMKELLDNLHEKISHLRKDHQKLIILRYIDGLSYKKIAQLMGYSESQVKSRLHQARKNLRRICKVLREQK
jgi:RNA polymerase sigma-70 factor (ECF subfamily)